MRHDVPVTGPCWDVRRVALVGVSAIALAACGAPQHVAPPEPEFVSGSRAEPAVQVFVDGGGETAAPIDPEDVVAEGADADGMVLVDDAGNAVPNGSGWEQFAGAIASTLGSVNRAVSVAVMVDGQLVHASASGERVAGDPVDVTDRFRIASISKTITAIVTMQLVEDGTLTLDDPVGDLLALHLGSETIDPDARSITVRELLSHTAGFPQHEGTFFSVGAASCVDAARTGLASGVASGGYRYSNMGYCVLGTLIEAVTGKTYERVVRERLLVPLGISGMRLVGTYELGPDEVDHAPTPGRNFMETLAAAGSWNATPSDLVLILNSIDPDTPGWKALSPDTARSMRISIDGVPESGYGLGLIKYGADFGHKGTLQNTHSMVLRQDNGVTWAVTVAGNYPSSSGTLRGIVKTALAQAFPS